MSLSKNEQIVAGQISEILNRVDMKGNPVYSEIEKRDFIVMVIFQFGLETPPELYEKVTSFLSDLDVPEGATMDDFPDTVMAYFDKHPLNSDMQNAFLKISREAVLRGEEGFSGDVDKASAARSVGGSSKLEAPKIKTQRKGTAPKRGL